MLSKDFLELLELLNQHQVRYLVAGGYATSIYAEPRYTKDLDVWVDATPQNSRRILAALAVFGFGSVGLGESDFTREDHVVQLGYEPNRIDFLTQLKGLTFESAWSRRNPVTLDGVRIPFLSVADLVANKRAVGLLRDQADVEDILRYQDLKDDPPAP